MIIWCLYFALAVYFMLDGFHTSLLLSVGFEEANPILAYLIEAHGIEAMFYLKATLLGVLGLLLTHYTRNPPWQKLNS